MNTKAFFALPALLLMAGLSHAQTASTTGATGANPTVTAMTREMSTRLQLNEGQFIKLATINRTRLNRQQEIERATATDAATRTSQLAELQAQYEQECARILTPSQLSQLQQDPAQFPSGSGRG
ncbi:MAG: hypothetical protein EOO56_12245 [Hymenobacter sp.]|nr:MAG: hypothetical protein EOO56_12245 [Hymenobacter sp.]